MTPDPTAAETVTDALEGVLPQLLTVGAAALGIGIGALVLTKGWRYAKRFF